MNLEVAMTRTEEFSCPVLKAKVEATFAASDHQELISGGRGPDRLVDMPIYCSGRKRCQEWTGTKCPLFTRA